MHINARMRSKSKRNHFSKQKAELNQYVATKFSVGMCWLANKRIYMYIGFNVSFLSPFDIFSSYMDFGQFLLFLTKWRTIIRNCAHFNLGCRKNVGPFICNVVRTLQQENELKKKTTMNWFQISYFEINVVGLEMKVKMFDRGDKKKWLCSE